MIRKTQEKILASHQLSNYNALIASSGIKSTFSKREAIPSQTPLQVIILHFKETKI